MNACKPLGYNLSDIQHLIDKQLLTVIRPARMTSCIRMLKEGRIDLIPINKHVGWSLLKEVYGEDAYAQFKTLEKPLQEDHLHLIVSKTTPNGREILAKFNKGLKKIKARGVWQVIVTRHLEYSNDNHNEKAIE